MYMRPEAEARLIIDKKLAESGWTLQDYKSEFNPAASLGVYESTLEPHEPTRMEEIYGI